MAQTMIRPPLTSLSSQSMLPKNDFEMKHPVAISEDALSIQYPFEADTIGTALHVIDTERDALSNLSLVYRTNDLARRSLAAAVSTIARVRQNAGRLVVTGIGKSGKIVEKCVATMNSLGIRSVFLHPVEALHGDLGMIGPTDAILIISFSGRTPEILSLIPHLPPQLPRIVISSHLDSATCPLIQRQISANWILLPAPIPISETQSFGLPAPTSSTTVALALTDALALAVARTLHTDPGAVFERYHPGGAIGGAG